MKRLFDLLLAGIALVLLLPVFLIIAIAISINSKGGIFYSQERIGRGEKPFRIYKFRTMRPASDQQGLISLGSKDPRITRVGLFLRNKKLDELPQLWNIVKGDMSIVGPRPEVAHYVQHFTEEQKKTLTIRPGLTDYASLHYLDEDEILGQSMDPERAYIEDILPKKLALSLRYQQEQNLWVDIQIIGQTLAKLFF